MFHHKQPSLRRNYPLIPRQIIQPLAVHIYKKIPAAVILAHRNFVFKRLWVVILKRTQRLAQRGGYGKSPVLEDPDAVGLVDGVDGGGGAFVGAEGVYGAVSFYGFGVRLGSALGLGLPVETVAEASGVVAALGVTGVGLGEEGE
ncbi:MAG: hypothetical protein HUU34_17115 [Saprospiraceae bacterium]|nr:hypothetical protein [Saprospiraceae bacterium]